MASRRHIARDISYAHSASTRGGRVVIRLMENRLTLVWLVKRKLVLFVGVRLLR